MQVHELHHLLDPFAFRRAREPADVGHEVEE
jgi:hypothetical protein